MQLPKLVRVNPLLITKNHIKDKVGNMAQSASKRLEFKTKPKSKKSLTKHHQRQLENLKVLNKLKINP